MKPSILISGILAATPALAGTPVTPASKPADQAKLQPLTFANGLITLDYEGRARFEARNNNRDFDNRVNDDNDDSWVVTRLRLGVGIKPTSWLRFYAQTQDARELGSDRPNTPGIRGSEGDDTFDLRQAYVEFADYTRFPLGLTVGRQRLAYGDQRLVADSRWGNFGRTFDAIRLRWQPSTLQWLDLFASRPVQAKAEVFNDSDSADNFSGAYYSTEALRPQTTDAYVFYRDKADAQPDLDPINRVDPHGTWNGPAQRTATVGTRWKSKPHALAGWDYNFEAAGQWGEVWATDRSTPALDHLAFATHLSGGYTWEDAVWAPRLGFAYNFATGDSNPNDNRNESFQNLFPSNHGRFGEADFFGWRNLHNAQLRLLAKPLKSVEVELAYHANWLADTSDYWYRGNGYSTLRTKTPSGQDVRTVGASNFAGQELDLTVKWSVNPHFSVDAGYSHFFAGSYLRDTGPADDADFAYVQVTTAF